MADDRYDYYNNHPENRSASDRDRDVYLDNRTGASVPGRGYRASQEWDRSNFERRPGNGDHFGQGEETRSFRPDRDYGIDRGSQSGRNPDRSRDDAQWKEQRAASFNRAYSSDYNPYPSYGYGGYEPPRQHEGDPRSRGSQGGRENDRGFWDRTGDTLASWFGDDEARRRHQTDMAGQSHQGRGPKAYKRSDARIQEDVNDRFTDDHWLDATHIDVSVQDTEVTLAGTVGSRDDRRHAERLAEHVSGVTHVQNNLRVDASKAQGRDGARADSGREQEPGVAEGVNSTLDRQAQGRA
jgi:osmotically-inducible protein OsmY